MTNHILFRVCHISDFNRKNKLKEGYMFYPVVQENYSYSLHREGDMNKILDVESVLINSKFIKMLDVNWKDCNGVRIYEDDILKVEELNLNGEIEEWNGIVNLELPFLRVGNIPVVYLMLFGDVKVEVLGNVHENPELLRTI